MRRHQPLRPLDLAPGDSAVCEEMQHIYKEEEMGKSKSYMNSGHTSDRPIFKSLFSFFSKETLLI